MDNLDAYEHVRLLLASGEEAEAVRVYERLLLVDSEAKELLVPIAAMLLDQGRSTLAVRLAEGVLQDDPWSLAAHQVRVDALAESGALEDSALAAEEWAAATPDVMDAQLSLSWARLATFDQEGAHRAAVAARDLDPLSPTGWLAIAWVARLDRRWVDVIEHCQEALWMSPENADAQFLLGEAHLQLGDIETGRTILLDMPDDDRAKRLLEERGIRRFGGTLGLAVAVVFVVLGLLTASISLIVAPLLSAAIFSYRLSRSAPGSTMGHAPDHTARLRRPVRTSTRPEWVRVAAVWLPVVIVVIVLTAVLLPG